MGGFERRLPGQALVKDTAERKDIGARSDIGPAARLLRRHIERSSDRRVARAGGWGGRLFCQRLRQSLPGDAEVEQGRALEFAFM